MDNSLSQTVDEREVLLRTIDLLSLEVLRLKSENEVLRNSHQSKTRKFAKVSGNYPRREIVNVWTKTIAHIRREGFWNAVKRIISKLLRL